MSILRFQRIQPSRIILYAVISVCGAAADLWTKAAVYRWLGQTQSVYVVIEGFLHLIWTENSGAAFSVLTGQRWLLTGISAAALIFLNAFFLTGRIQGKWLAAACGCLNAGIIGNLYDRLFNEGRVRDFIDVFVGPYHWPTFNIADSLLCIGVGMLILHQWLRSEKSVLPTDVPR